MHANEYAIDTGLVRRLISEQMPQWAHLPLKHMASAGTDNAIFRLGSDRCVRLPRIPSAQAQSKREQIWLPKFEGLSLSVPRVLATGEATDDYPSVWSVCDWIGGESAATAPLTDLNQAAIDLANLIRELRTIGTLGAPLAGPENHYRAVDLAKRDKPTRKAIAGLSDLYASVDLTQIWNEALELPKWDAPPVWCHGDIHAGNLLAREGRLVAVIDFGLMGVGDPAVDLIVGWSLLDTESRDLFRSAVSVNDDTWQRGRGWAFSIALVALAYYRDTNRYLANMSRRVIEAVLKDTIGA